MDELMEVFFIGDKYYYHASKFQNHLKIRHEYGFDQHRRRVEAQEPNGVLSAESVDVFQLSSVIHCKFMTPFIRHFTFDLLIIFHFY